jgi:hypothetical protein
MITLNENSYFDIQKDIVAFKALPKPAQKAISGIYFIENGLFLGGGNILVNELSKIIPEDAQESTYSGLMSEEQWDDVLTLVAEHYGDKECFTYFEVPTKQMAEVLYQLH